MNQMAETDRSIARGELLEQGEDTIVLGLLGTEYRLHLALASPISVGPGKRIAGRISATAMRVDLATTGGRYIEPVYGRPRRLQGRIIATDAAANTITVYCGCPVVCTLTAAQSAGDLPLGAIATFDVKSGATFEPIEQ